MSISSNVRREHNAEFGLFGGCHTLFRPLTANPCRREALKLPVPYAAENQELVDKTLDIAIKYLVGV
jgi:hypothetical protein